MCKKSRKRLKLIINWSNLAIIGPSLARIITGQWDVREATSATLYMQRNMRSNSSQGKCFSSIGMKTWGRTCLMPSGKSVQQQLRIYKKLMLITSCFRIISIHITQKSKVRSLHSIKDQSVTLNHSLYHK